MSTLGCGYIISFWWVMLFHITYLYRSHAHTDSDHTSQSTAVLGEVLFLNSTQYILPTCHPQKDWELAVKSIGKRKLSE